MSEQNILIIGAGPASLYAAQELIKHDKNIVILNRDIKPGGLAEFGIYPNKYKMKKGLRRVFSKILSDDRVHYLGNVKVGEDEGADVSLSELEELGFDAVVVAVGAQGTKWLGLPGEEADSVFHAKDLVYHYNNLPPFSERDFPVGQRVCVVGLGNVALDIVHWLVCEHKCETAIAVARRGPAERAYTEKEMKIVSGALDIEAMDVEFKRIGPSLEAVGQDPEALKAEVLAHVDEPLETETPTRFEIRFLRSPSRIVTDESGQVTGLECDITRLVPGEDRMGVERTGETDVLECDTVIFAIGDSIEPGIGLPLNPENRKAFATCPRELEPDTDRYMVYDPQEGEPQWGTFVVGWARKASDGLVGKARLDAVTGCKEILAYLDGNLERAPGEPQPVAQILSDLRGLLARRAPDAVDYDAVEMLEERETQLAKELGVPEYKFKSSDEMLAIVRGQK